MYRGQYGKQLSSNLTMSFQNNSGYGLNSEALTGDLSLRYNDRTDQTTLDLQHSATSSGTSTSDHFASDLNYQHRIGATGAAGFQSSYSNSSYGTGTAADQELLTQATWRQDFPHFGINLAADRRFDLNPSSSTANSYFTLNRLPDISITTDSARLGNRQFLHNAFDATVYMGYFEQEPAGLETYRTGFEFRLPGTVHQFGQDASLRTSARFRQMFYDGAASGSRRATPSTACSCRATGRRA